MTIRRRRRQGGKCADRVWKTNRARKAAAARDALWWAELETMCEKFGTRGAAFKAGYRLGYYRAYRGWKRHLTAIRRAA